MIPPDITQEDILAALKEIDKTGEPINRESKNNILIHSKQQYSPKYLFSIVTRMKTGKELQSSDFGGTEAKNFLISLNFPVLNKKDLDKAILNLKNIYEFRETYKEMSDVIKSRDEVISKYQLIFKNEAIDTLTGEDIEGFLDFKNNRHWTGLYRTKGGYLNSISGVKKILSALLNEATPISGRFQIIGTIAEEEQIKGLGKGILTAILHIAYPEKYGVWNTTSEEGLKKIGLWPSFQSKASEGEKYSIINEILNYLSLQVGVDLWTLDALWWRIGTLNSTNIRYWKISPEAQAVDWPYWKTNNLIAIFWPELYDSTGRDILKMDDDEIASAFNESYPDNPKSSGPRQISIFLHEIKPGDKIVVNIGKKVILAYGQVESEPIFDNTRVSKIIRNVIWENTNVDIPIPDYLKLKLMPTVVELTEDEYNILTGSKLKYWGVLPSEGSGKQGTELFFWDTWKEKGVVTTSFWKDFIKLHGVSLIEFSHHEYEKAFRDFYQKREHSDMIWKFINQMQIGDKVLLNRGKRTIFAVGEVESDPYLNESGDSFVRKIRWTPLSEEILLPDSVKNRFSRYIISLSSNEYHQIFQAEPVSEEYHRLDRLLMKKGQVILYGPPGTGKTYHSSKYIESKIKNLPKITDILPDISKKFYWFTINPDRWDPEKLWNVNEIDLWYGNMKQAFSDIEESDIVFCYVSGVHYQRIAAIASCARKTFNPDGIPQVFLKGLRKIDGPDWKTLKSDGILSASLPVRTGARGTLFPLTSEEGFRILSMQNLSPSEIGIEERITVPEIKPKNIITFHPSFSYEEFIEGIMPSIGTDGAIQYQVKEGIFKAICRTAYNSLLHYLSIEKIWNADSDIPSLTPEEKDQLYLRAQELPHFLMIDEINRGDISRILGELITLLERDKRACSPNELSVTLPYSRTRFAIPPNLYIIGTMNTADKSIALVDVALRRRFGFIEMLPDQTILREYLSHDSLEIQKIFTLAINLLEEINIRIIKEFDRDHQLGHSYLMRLKDCSSREEAVSEFWSIWYDEMMPLLQEYFYDAPTRLHAVIGEGFVEYNTHSLIIHPDKDEEEFLTALQMILDTDPR